MQRFLVVVFMVVCLVAEASALTNGPQINFSVQGQNMAGLEVEILGLGIKGRTDSAGNFDCSALNERILQKKISTSLSDKIRVLVKTLQDVPTQVIEFPMAELTSEQIKRIELKKSSTVREQANVLKVVGPHLRNDAGELISGVEILVLGDHSRDSVQEGLISLTPYIDDRDHSFTMVLVGNGYETKFVRVNIPRHKRGEEVFRAAKGDLTLKPDFFKPIDLVLTAPPELSLDSSVGEKKVEYWQSGDHFAVRVVITTESKNQYYGWYTFPKEQAGGYPLLERQEIAITKASSLVPQAFAPLDDLRGLPNFVLAEDSLRFLKVAQPTPPKAQSGPKTQEGLSFGMKFLIVCLLIVGLGVLLYVVQSLRIRKRESRAEAERALRQRYLDAGIDFLDRVNYALDRAGDTMSLASAQGVAQLLEDSSEVVQKFLRNSLKIKADIERVTGVLKILHSFRQRLVGTMRQYLNARQYSQTKTVQGQIQSVEAQIKKVEDAKTGLEEALQKNNKGLQDAVDFLNDLVAKVKIKEELERLKREVPQALRDFMGSLPVDQEAALDIDELMNAAEANQDLEKALREVEGEEEVTELAEVDALAKFLESREGGGRAH